MKLILSIAVSLLLLGCSANASANGSDVMVTSFSQAMPDEHGVVAQYMIEAGEFEDVVLFASGWWPGGGNRLYPRYGGAGDLIKGFDGGVMVLFKHSADSYSCYLAGVNDDIFSWISTDDGKEFILNTGTLGNKPYSGEDKIIYTVAEGKSPYEVINRVWKLHKESSHNTSRFKFREQKEYPEYFKYLGWCSWEGFKRNITAEKLIKVNRQIEASGIPIRYMLIDDGHQQQHEGDPWDYNTITRFGPMEKIFPNGYEELLECRKDDKVKWMGLWLAGLGGRDGIFPENTLPKEVQEILTMSHMKALIPEGTPESSHIFYDHYIDEHITEPGWDFAKIDFQSRTLTHYAGGEMANVPVKDNSGAFDNAFLAARNMAIALERSLDDDDKGVINCNSLASFALFNLDNSVVARCSEDYWVYDKGRARNHLHNSYANIPLLGQVVWGDHDMFHSCDSISGRMMAISKAVSGGPVYLSDLPDHFEKGVIMPLCYNDGELLRPLAPASPTHSSMFTNAQTQREAYLAFAPLANRSVAVVAYNLFADIQFNEKFFNSLREAKYPEEFITALRECGVSSFKNNDEYEVFLKGFRKEYPKFGRQTWQMKSLLFDAAGSAVVKAKIDSRIYSDAPALMQGEQRSWELPKEGLLCYDWNRRSAVELGGGYSFSIDGFGDELFMLVPIDKGWGVVGDATKYLSPAGYMMLYTTDKKLVVEMREGGELMVWNRSAKGLKVKGAKVSKVGDKLWQIDVPATMKRVEIEMN